jgi:RNA polymerase sigma-70 factor (ECF subfamily)
MLLVAENPQLPVEEARAGEPGAWDILFRRYQLPLYTYVFELVRHEQTSLDVVQETFINAVRHIGSLRDDSRFGSWLFGIAHQKCIQHWRRNRSPLAETTELDDEFPIEADDPGQWLVRKEQEEQFMNLIAQLPPVQRSALLLHFVEGFSLEEIAAITATKAGTVKSRLHYAKKLLRRLLEGKL